MSKRKIVSVAFTGVAATGIAGFAAAPALAAGPWNITGGGPVKAHNTTAADLFKDVKTGHKITCSTSRVNLSGTVKSGNSQSNPIGTISKSGTIGTSAAPCAADNGVNFKGHVSAPMHLSASAQSSLGLVSGKVTGVSVVATSLTFGGLCTFKTTGSVQGTYSNGTGILTAAGGPTLHESVLAGHSCAGLVNTSDSASWTGPLTVTNTAGGHPQINHV